MKWQGEWIGGTARGGKRTGAPAPYLRRAFDLTQPIAKPSLQITVLGLYECDT